MVSNHRLVLFTHALCRLSYPATLRTTAPGFRSGLFRDRARRSERSSWALPSWSPLRSHRPDPCSPGPSQSIDSPPLPRKRSSRGEGVFGTWHCADPRALPCNAQRFVRFLTDINFFWRECGPLGPRRGAVGIVGGLRERRNCPGSAPTTRSVGVAFDQVGFQERKVPGT